MALEPRNGLTFRIVVDGAMIASMLFFAGVGWSKLDNMQSQLDHNMVSPERLARVEEKIDYLIREVNRLQHQADRDSR